MNRFLKMADDINDGKKADIQTHYSKLVKEIPTHDILPYLSQCLFPWDMETLTRRLRNESNMLVNEQLLEILQYRRYWWIHLSNALIHIERPDLLVAMGWSTEIQTADQVADTSRRVHDTQSSRSSNESLHSTFTSSNLRNDLSEARVSRISHQSLSENNLLDADVSDRPVPSPQQGIDTLPTNVTPSPVAEDLSGTVPTPVCSSGTVPTPVESSNRTGISNPTGTPDEHNAVESSNIRVNTDPGALRAAVGGRSGVASTERATPHLRETAVSSIQESEPSIDLANQHNSISVTGLRTPSLGLPTLNLSNQHDSISLYRVRLASLGLPSLYDIANDSGVRRSVGSAFIDAFFR